MADAQSPASVEPRPTGPDGDVVVHLAWAKARAREYLDAGDSGNALMSFFSDMSKHDELRNHAGIELGLLLLMSGHLSTVTAVRDHIEGCA